MVKSLINAAISAVCAAMLSVVSHSARAVPAFAGQTGQPCSACHIGSFGPELTLYGRLFKISGYTMQGGTGTLANLPLAMFVQTSFTNTAKGQGGPAAPDFGANNNFAVDQVSLFLAGRATNYAGGFIQATYDGVGHGFFLDNTDLRLTTPITIGTHEIQIGLSANNGPMVQDPYNTTYAWNFPFIASSLAPTPTAGTILGGPLLGNTIGLTAYAWMDQSLYTEAGFYDTQAPELMSRLGESYGPGSATAPAPYVRLAYEWNWGHNSAHIGTAFFRGRFNPATDTFSASGTLGHDTYTDTYFDAGYQYLSHDGRHTVTLNDFFTHEDQSLKGTAAGGGATTADGTVNETRLVGTYYFDRTYGATVAWSKLWGSANPLLYQQGAAVSGSANGKPDSNAYILEADWVPFGKAESWLRPLANLKLGLQYTIYTEFNGGSRNYDGFGRNASDNNTLFLFAWFVF
jgi:hypothetical protein